MVPLSFVDDNETQQQQHFNKFVDKTKNLNAVAVDIESIEFPDDEIDDDKSYIEDDDDRSDDEHENVIPDRWMSILPPDSPLLIPTASKCNNNNNNFVDTTIATNGENCKIWWSGICLNDCIVAESVDTEMESLVKFNPGNKQSSKASYSHSTILKIRKTLLRSNSTVSSTLYHQQHQQKEIKETNDDIQSTSLLSSSPSMNNGWNVVTYAIKHKRTMFGIQFNIYQKKPFTIGSKIVIMDELIGKRNSDGMSNSNHTNKLRIGIVVEYFSNEDKYLIRTVPRQQQQQPHKQQSQNHKKKPSPRSRTSLSFEDYMSISTSTTTTNSTSKSMSPLSTSSSEIALSQQQRIVDKPILTIVQSEYLRRYEYPTGTIEENNNDCTTESLQKWTFAALYTTTSTAITAENKDNDKKNDMHRFRVCQFLDVIMGMASTFGFMNPSSYSNTKQSIIVADEYYNDYTNISHEDSHHNSNNIKTILSSCDKNLQELMGPILTCQMRKFSSPLPVLDANSLNPLHVETGLQEQQKQENHYLTFNELFWSTMFTESNYRLLQTAICTKENRNRTNANPCSLIMDTECDERQQEPVKSVLDILADLSQPSNYFES